MSQEDLGVAYESFVKARYVENLRVRSGLETILETRSANSEDYVLTTRGVTRHVVILEHIRGENPKRVKSGWNWNHASAACDVVVGKLSDMPFRSRTFDLACSSEGEEWDVRAVEHMEEITRVSSRFLLIFFPNPLHIGHLIRRRFGGKRRSPNAMQKSWISVAHVCETIRNAGLKIIEKGGIDAPPWPSHLRVRNLARRSGFKWQWAVRGGRRCSRVIWLLAELERVMPGWFRAFHGHVVYVLASKEVHTTRPQQLAAPIVLRDEALA